MLEYVCFWWIRYFRFIFYSFSWERNVALFVFAATATRKVIQLGQVMSFFFTFLEVASVNQYEMNFLTGIAFIISHQRRLELFLSCLLWQQHMMWSKHVKCRLDLFVNVTSHNNKAGWHRYVLYGVVHGKLTVLWRQRFVRKIDQLVFQYLLLLCLDLT